jgi:hypothetical protein
VREELTAAAAARGLESAAAAHRLALESVQNPLKSVEKSLEIGENDTA